MKQNDPQSPQNVDSDQPDAPENGHSGSIDHQLFALNAKTRSIAGQLGWLLASLWNLFATRLDQFATLPLCEKYPWILVVLGFLLPIVAVPFGIAWVMCFVATCKFSATPQTHFMAFKGALT